ncbi:MAG: hypothetical protein EBX39_13865, partial [Actinobacteria bacterium]|nr:hypothetical protein [Actinomycetota bacterium]
MMANDDIWILGINMTKFGKHPDKDVVDLAAEAALAALADGGVTIKDMGVLAAGNLMGAAAGLGQQLQKQIGQTGIPVYNVANACATGATALRTVIMAVKSGECDMGLAVGVEKLSGAGMLGAGFGAAKSEEWTRSGRHGTVSGFEGKLGTDMMPGVFAQVGMEYLHANPYDGAEFELFARISAKNHFNSTMNQNLGAGQLATNMYQTALTGNQNAGKLGDAFTNSYITNNNTAFNQGNTQFKTWQDANNMNALL